MAGKGLVQLVAKRRKVSTRGRATTFGPLYTANTWQQVWEKMFIAANRKRPAKPGETPRITNADAVAFVREWHNVARPEMEVGPIWYQFAAVAYAWDPPRNDKLRQTEAQADALYPLAFTKDLWAWSAGIAKSLDKVDHLELQGPPRVSLDRDSFMDPVYAASVRAQLQQDGADASVTAKVPTGYCIDKKTGQRRAPYPPCDKDGRGPYLGVDKSGKPIYGLCDKPGECVPETVDDPLTSAQNDLVTFAVWVGIAWLLLSTPKRSSRG